MERVYNFSPGPGMLPEEVLNQVREDLVGGALLITPRMLDYGKHVENGSMYNAMPYEGVRRLVEAMKEFEARYG